MRKAGKQERGEFQVSSFKFQVFSKDTNGGPEPTAHGIRHPSPVKSVCGTGKIQKARIRLKAPRRCPLRQAIRQNQDPLTGLKTAIGWFAGLLLP